MKKAVYCILAVFSLLLGGCQSSPPQSEPEIPVAEIYVVEKDGYYSLQDSNGNDIPTRDFYQFPNGNLLFCIQKWIIFDKTGEVLYDDIDALFSDFHAHSYLEDGSTLHRFFHSSGDLLMEGIGDYYVGWHHTGFGTCFYQLDWGYTRVRNFDTNQEVYLPISPIVTNLDSEWGEETGILLLSNPEDERSYLVDENMIVLELDEFFTVSLNEDGEPCLRRKDGTLCDLNGTPLPNLDLSVQEELPDES